MLCWCRLESSFDLEPSSWPCWCLKAVSHILCYDQDGQHYASVLMVLRCEVLFVSAVLENDPVHLLLVWSYGYYCCMRCLVVALLFCFRSLGIFFLVFAAVLWACPRCCPHFCHTSLLASAGGCWKLSQYFSGILFSSCCTRLRRPLQAAGVLGLLSLCSGVALCSPFRSLLDPVIFGLMLLVLCLKPALIPPHVALCFMQ